MTKECLCMSMSIHKHGGKGPNGVMQKGRPVSGHLTITKLAGCLYVDCLTNLSTSCGCCWVDVEEGTCVVG